MNEEFCNLWGNMSVAALDQKLLDHCPIVLKDVDLDFGSRPFRAFDVLLEEKDIGHVVEEAWKVKEDALWMEKYFSEGEILDAIRGCGGDKAPGPDDFNFKYIKKFWDILKSDLIIAIRWFGETMEISSGCNASFVTIIPKVTDPIGLGDFRPISLIGCYYKIIAMVLAERIKGWSERKTRCKGLIFKVDFEKAYDSLNWRFLSDIMKKIGFGNKWCSWIESCLWSSIMSILVNRSPTEEFCLERGVRQGDPLSPFLFILVAEGLNAIIKEAVDKGKFRGVKVGRNNVVVSHLQYADDNIFVGEWNKKNEKSLMCILKCFEEVSGLCVNYNKSKLYGVGGNELDLRDMAGWMRCGVGELPFTYL
ncbi:putative RNA-directed DNA polymerase, eukaryota, reverse transcriptase zinc-binding domain protein [Tanacetum coccineum]